MDHSGLPFAFGSLCARLAVFHIERMKHEHRRSMAGRAGPGRAPNMLRLNRNMDAASAPLHCPEAAEGGMAEQGPSEFKLYLCPKLRLIGQKVCLILGVGAGQRPFFMGKVIRIDFSARTKSVSGY